MLSKMMHDTQRHTSSLFLSLPSISCAACDDAVFFAVFYSIFSSLDAGDDRAAYRVGKGEKEEEEALPTSTHQGTILCRSGRPSYEEQQHTLLQLELKHQPRECMLLSSKLGRPGRDDIFPRWVELRTTALSSFSAFPTRYNAQFSSASSDI